LNKIDYLKDFFPKFPPVGLELSQRWAGLVQVRRHKGMLEIASYAIRQLTEGLIPCSLSESGELKMGEIREMLSAAIRDCSHSLKRLSLVIPDNLARIVLFNNLPKIPRSRRELLELIKWRMEKKFPFKLEEAVVDFQLLPGAKGKSLLAIAIPINFIKQFEEMFSSLGIQVGLIIPSSFALVNFYYHMLYQDGESEDRFFINMSDYYISFFIFQGEKALFFRSKNLPRGISLKDDSFALLIEQARLTLLYYQDNLKGENGLKFYLGGINPNLFQFKALLEKELLLEGEIINPSASNRLKEVSAVYERSMVNLSSALGAALGI